MWFNSGLSFHSIVSISHCGLHRLAGGAYYNNPLWTILGKDPICPNIRGNNTTPIRGAMRYLYPKFRARGLYVA